MQPPRVTALEDNTALGSLQASPQTTGQTTGVTGTVCPGLDGSAVHSRVSLKSASQKGGGVTIPEVIALMQ
ncbi:UNVERIFIED_CONTAM: hypothetical protein FKN15_045466 [Acipenser sinensis]